MTRFIESPHDTETRGFYAGVDLLQTDASVEQ